MNAFVFITTNNNQFLHFQINKLMFSKLYLFIQFNVYIFVFIRICCFSCKKNFTKQFQNLLRKQTKPVQDTVFF